MKVLAINGSPRKGGNTELMIREVFNVLSSAGIQTELIQIGGRLIRGCRACRECYERRDEKCIYDDDIINECVARMKTAQGIIIGSPTYFADLTSETKALIDRVGYVVRANGNLLHHKVGAAVVAVRRAGALHVFDSINHFFLINQMVVPGSSYWNLSLARNPGDFERDEEGVQTMRTLGENMVWLLKKLNPSAL